MGAVALQSSPSSSAPSTFIPSSLILRVRVLLTQPQDSAPAANWEQALRQWADQALGRGQSNLLDSAVPAFERIMIETALKHTAGRRRDAAVLLGWGRNTLTRKIKELGMNVDGADDEGDD